MKKKRSIVVLVILLIIICTYIYLSGMFVSYGNNDKQVLYENENYSIVAKINDKYISAGDLNKWIIKRIRYVEEQLGFETMEETNAEEMLENLTNEKLELSYDVMLNKIQNNVDIGQKLTELAVLLSNGKTKYCITTLYVEGVDLEVFLKEFDRLQQENSNENLKVNLGVAPDHYYLGVNKNGQLEVIETTGNTPVQLQFFITYGDTDSLNSHRDQFFDFQSAGIAQTKSGIVEDGVRHQFKKTDNGFEAQLLVEFPIILPDTYIKNHQMHLACEFSHWIRWVADNIDGAKLN